MTTRLVLAAAATSLLVLALAKQAHATYCFSGDAASGKPWNATNIKVYIHHNPDVMQGPNMGLRYALNMSFSEIEYAVWRTLHILNEEVGGKIKLQYAGATTSWNNIDYAIVLRSNQHDCSDGTDGIQAGALATANAISSGNYRMRGRVNFYRKNFPQCFPLTYNVMEQGGMDVVSLLIHELGHAFYDVGHAGDPSDPSCYISLDGEAIMRPSAQTYPRTRVIRDWDREVFQTRHGSRGQFSSFRRNNRLSTGWGNTHEVPDTWDIPFHYRPGSFTQSGAYRNVGFLQHGASLPLPGGGGIQRTGRYHAGGFAHQEIGEPFSMMRPIAVASRAGTQEVLVVYLRRSIGGNGPGADVGRICYRRSTNSGITYSSETCEPNWRAYRNGLTVAHSAHRNVFLVGFLGDEDDHVYIGLIPGVGSAIGTGHSSRIGFNPSWHAPAVACRTDPSDAMGCRIVWEDKTNLGCRTTVVAGVGFLGTVIIGTPSKTPCLVMVDTPGLAYNPSNNTFELSNTHLNHAIYAYRMPANSPGLSWTGNGDIWNSPNSFVLSGVLSFHSSSMLQAWFIKYH